MACRAEQNYKTGISFCLSVKAWRELQKKNAEKVVACETIFQACCTLLDDDLCNFRQFTGGTYIYGYHNELTNMFIVVWTCTVYFCLYPVHRLTLRLLVRLGGSDSYCSIKPFCSGMGEVVLARTSPTLLPHPLALCCNYPVSKCPSASIVVTSIVRVKSWVWWFCWLMIPSLRKDIWCHVWPYSFSILTYHQTRHQSTGKLAISLVIADGHLIFLRVSVGVYGLTCIYSRILCVHNQINHDHWHWFPTRFWPIPYHYPPFDTDMWLINAPCPKSCHPKANILNKSPSNASCLVHSSF